MNRKVLWLGGIALLLLIYLFYPAKMMESGIKIGRDPQNFGADLFGKEPSILALTNDLLDEMPSSFTPITVGRDYFRSELAKGTISGFIFYGNDNRAIFPGLLESDTFFPLGSILVVRTDSPVTNNKEIEGKSIGVIKNSSIYLALDKLPTFKIVPAETIWTLFDLVLTKRVDGIVLDTLAAYVYLYRIHKDVLRFVPPPLTNAGIRLFAPNTPAGQDLIAKFNHDLATLTASGKLKELFENWDFPDYPILPPPEVPPPPPK
jgi:hypothetical protein